MESCTMTVGCVILLLTIWTGIISSGEPREYCQADSFEAECPDGEVILMEMARYGRMRAGKCISTTYDRNCEEDVLSFFDQKCSGRSVCSVYVASKMLYQMNPCTKELAPYLEAAFTCIPVATAGLASCHESRSTEMMLTAHQGYIASDVTVKKNPVGTKGCPWTIRVPEGQKIKLTLLPFGRGRMTSWSDDSFPSGQQDVPSPAGAADGSMACERLGTITEHGIQNTLTPCSAGTGRELSVFTSNTNQIEVYLNPGVDLNTRWPFLVKYQAIGCPRLQPPQGAYLDSSGEDTAVVKCNKSGETWYLTCGVDGWVGDLKNCSKEGVSSTTGSKYLDIDDQNFPFVLTDGAVGMSSGILLIVALGVALGVFLGGILLTFAAVHMKKKRNKKYQKPHTSADLYSAYQTRSHDPKSKLHSTSSSHPQAYYDMDGFSSHDYGQPAECPTHGGGLNTNTGTSVQQADLLMHNSDLLDSNPEQRHHQHNVVHGQYGTNARPISSQQQQHLYEKTHPRHGT